MFDRYAKKLDQNVYNSLKGKIRLELLKRDIFEFCPDFARGSKKVLDVGGGAGRFAEICLGLGHKVVLCDNSPVMIAQAEKLQGAGRFSDDFTVIEHDFLQDHQLLQEGQYDFVAMHGSAEWMTEQVLAIEKAIRLTRQGGYLSLLMFNKDKYDFKRGCNSHLLHDVQPKKKKLIPPGAMSVQETTALLVDEGCEVLVQSGVRIFYNVFRQFEQDYLTEDEWLAQEIAFSRISPYSLLGEHTHFFCRVGFA